MATENKSEEQRHYESLTSYFKTLVYITAGAITIIAAVGIYTTYNSLADARNEVKEHLGTIEETVKEASKNSLETFRNLQTQANQEVQNFKNETRNFALTETKIRVSEAFEENKITQLVEQTAEKKLKKRLEKIVEEQVIKTQKIIENQMKVIPILFLAVDKIRQGERSGLTILDSLRFHAKDPLIRKLSNDAFAGKAGDYEKYYKSEVDNKTMKQYIQDFQLGPNISVNDTVSILRGILRIIQTDQELNNVAPAVLAINKITGEKFKMFDFESINKWSDIYFENK